MNVLKSACLFVIEEVYSHAFQSGVAQCSVTDGAHDNHWYTSRILNGSPASDSAAYKKSSPIYYAAGLQDKLHWVPSRMAYYVDGRLYPFLTPLELLRVVLRRAPWLGASFAAVLALAIQTDVIGVHWLAFVLYALAGERA